MILIYRLLGHGYEFWLQLTTQRERVRVECCLLLLHESNEKALELITAQHSTSAYKYNPNIHTIQYRFV
jgi:hypothetical protein